MQNLASLAPLFKLTSDSEKTELSDEARRIIKTIKEMEVSLEGRTGKDVYQLESQDLKVTVPLTRCLQTLKEKHNAIAKIHRERFEQVKSRRCLEPHHGYANWL